MAQSPSYWLIQELFGVNLNANCIAIVWRPRRKHSCLHAEISTRTPLFWISAYLNSSRRAQTPLSNRVCSLLTMFFSPAELFGIYNLVGKLTRLCTSMLTCDRIRYPTSTSKDRTRELRVFRMNFKTELDAWLNRKLLSTVLWATAPRLLHLEMTINSTINFSGAQKLNNIKIYCIRCLPMPSYRYRSSQISYV